MISGGNFVIRRARLDDIDNAKALVDRHKNELGFVIRSALVTSVSRGELLVALSANDDIVGLVHFRHRRDKQSTLYSIVVSENVRSQSIGRALLAELVDECQRLGQERIVLKCPVELPANSIYPKFGFTLTGTENGKHRRLNIWQLELPGSN
ncbi:MAG: hypothetical protein AELANPGJ_03633 [Anaerolineae bacterium]|nr:hypothetical protein [Anaerolineae bacterium]